MLDDSAASVTFLLRNEAIEVITRGTGISFDAINAIAWSSPLPRTRVRQVTCSPATARELLEWFRTEATNALRATLPQSIEHGRHCIEATLAIRATVDAGPATRRQPPPPSSQPSPGSPSAG